MSHASAVPVDELNERYLCHPRRKPWPSTSGSAPASRKQAGKKQGQKRQRPVAQSRNGGRRGREQGHRDHDRGVDPAWRGDRKSTRLNSSHLVISYAVFCLK